MTRKKTIIICLMGYIVLAGFFFVKNIVLAKDNHSTYQDVIVKEQIEDEDQRATLRAFYTSPPVIPHEVITPEDRDCLSCHLNSRRFEDGRVSKATPHPQFTSCMQCHVPTTVDEFDGDETFWQGMEEPKRGDRWFVMSPPTVPHRIKLRENCLSCHGPESPDMKLRTPHPERTSCLQCHVPNYNNEFELDRK